jgi:hypothetical protein
MIHTNDSFIPTGPAPQISGASDDLLHQLKKKSGAGAVPNSPLITPHTKHSGKNHAVHRFFT